MLRNLCQHEPYRWEVLEMVRNAIQEEIKQIAKEDCDLYKGQASNCDHSCEFDWQHTQNELQLKAPYLYSVFSSAICLHEKKNLKQMLTSIAVLLYGRSQIMNQLQFVLGLILHKYGLSKRVIITVLICILHVSQCRDSDYFQAEVKPYRLMHVKVSEASQIYM